MMMGPLLSFYMAWWSLEFKPPLVRPIRRGTAAFGAGWRGTNIGWHGGQETLTSAVFGPREGKGKPARPAGNGTPSGYPVSGNPRGLLGLRGRSCLRTLLLLEVHDV